MREKGYTLIHIFSLGMGVGCFLFLLLLYQYAIHFNEYNTKAGRIYRVVDQVTTKSGNEVSNALTPMPWGPAMKSQFPGISNYTRFLVLGKSVIHNHDVFNTGISYTDSSIFKVFTYPFAKGDPIKALNGPNKAVLTHATATKLFGDSNPINKMIKIDNRNYKVTGVLKKLSHQSSLNNNFSVLVSTENLNSSNFKSLHDWNNHNVETYLLLKKGANPDNITHQMTAFIQHYIGTNAAQHYSPKLQPMLKMYLGPSYMNDPHATLQKSYLYIFLTLGFMILLISCINFINISTARASKRNQEIGIRKVIGATGEQLIFQYLFEVGMVTILAIFLALLLIELVLPMFNALSSWAVHLNILHDPFLWISTLSIFVFVTLMAGGYPAFYLSRFRPARIFRPTSSGNRKSTLRAGLVVTQFTLAVFMLLCALIVRKQVSYLFNKNLGYNRQGVMRIFYSGTRQQAKHFENDINRNALIKNVSLVSNGPFSNGTIRTFSINKNGHTQDALLHTFYADSHYLPLLHLKIISGRNFNRQIASDSSHAIIINRAAIKSFGWNSADAIGKRIIEKQNGKSKLLTVVGVIQNYNYEGLNTSIKPMAFLNDPNHFSMLVIKVDPGHIQAASKFIRDTWKKDFPDHFYYGQFIQAQIKQWYNLEYIISKMLTFITYLTIIIACLGLLGLAAYSTIQRAKEISVRKVLGATIQSIVILLSKEFLQFIGMALVIGIPLAYFALKWWLNNYVYHASIGFAPIVMVILATFIIAWLTIGWQTIKAALANPADNLRNE
jgi:putative ABC transport system permease protein